MEGRISAVGSLTEIQHQLLATLVDELLPLAAIPSLQYFNQVIVVPRAAIPKAVNVLRLDELYVPGPFQTPAVAVPIERGGRLECSVVLSLEDVSLLAPQRRRPLKLVSSLLEELLHIRVYVMAWEERGWLFPPHLTEKEHGLFGLCSNVHDEYFVCREKTAISVTQAIYEHPTLPGMLTTCLFSYGGNVASDLMKAAEASATMTRLLAADEVSLEEAWTSMIHIGRRDIFEPLARDAGFRAGTPKSEVSQPSNASEISFFQKQVAPYWQAALPLLEHSYQTQLREMTSSIDDFTEIVGMFIVDILNESVK